VVAPIALAGRHGTLGVLLAVSTQRPTDVDLVRGETPSLVPSDEALIARIRLDRLAFVRHLTTSVSVCRVLATD